MSNSLEVGGDYEEFLDPREEAEINSLPPVEPDTDWYLWLLALTAAAFAMYLFGK